MTAQGKHNADPHGERERVAYSSPIPQVQVCFIPKYYARNKYLKTAPLRANEVDVVRCL